MYTNKTVSTFAQNQNSGIKAAPTAGTRKMAAIKIAASPNETRPTTGRGKRSTRRAGRAACKKLINPAPTKISGGIRFEPYAAGKMGCQPPRNSSVATQETVTMLQYSAIKNAANFMLPYSV